MTHWDWGTHVCALIVCVPSLMLAKVISSVAGKKKKVCICSPAIIIVFLIT